MSPGRTRRGDQLRVLLAVLRRLAAGWCTVDELAAELGVSRRTVLRLMREMRLAGIRVRARRLDPDRPKVVSHRLARGWWRPGGTSEPPAA